MIAKIFINEYRREFWWEKEIDKPYITLSINDKTIAHISGQNHLHYDFERDDIFVIYYYNLPFNFDWNSLNEKIKEIDSELVKQNFIKKKIEK